MSKLIGELISEVQSHYSKGVKSTDSRLSNRMVYAKMKTLRAKLIVEKFNKKEILSDNFYQLLSGVEMVESSESQLSTIQINTNILKTKYELPTIIYNQDNPLIQSVTTINGDKTYNRTTWQTVKNAKGRKFTGTSVNYFITGNNLSLNEVVGPRAISVKSIFEDPIQAQIYPIYEDCTVNCTSYLDMIFAIDEDMSNTVITMVSDELINTYLKKQDDREQNASDNT